MNLTQERLKRDFSLFLQRDSKETQKWLFELKKSLLSLFGAQKSLFSHFWVSLQKGKMSLFSLFWVRLMISSFWACSCFPFPQFYQGILAEIATVMNRSCVPEALVVPEPQTSLGNQSLWDVLVLQSQEHKFPLQIQTGPTELREWHSQS